MEGIEGVRWLPDRNQIEYLVRSSQQNGDSLWVMKSDGSNRKQIIPCIAPGFGAELARLSYDQRYAAFRRSDKGKHPSHWEVDIVDIETGTAHQLMDGAWTFEWSPTSNLLAISRWCSDCCALYIVQPDGIILDKYQDAVLDVPILAWSPDGLQIAFASSYSLEQGQSLIAEIYAINTDNDQKTRLTSGTDQYKRRLITSLTWSPDGKYIAFVSDYVNQDGTGENNALFVVDVHFGHEVRLASDVEWSLPVWSPDGKRIAFVSTMDSPSYGQIYLADVTLGTITQLTCDDRIKKSLSW